MNGIRKQLKNYYAVRLGQTGDFIQKWSNVTAGAIVKTILIYTIAGALVKAVLILYQKKLY